MNKDKTTSHFDPNVPAVFAADDGAIIVDSRDSAAHFGKRHDHLLRKIDQKMADIARMVAEGGLPKTGDTPLPVFREVKTVDQQNGEKYRSFEMDRRAHSLIVLGFTGEKALKWQIDYINTFERMEAERRQPSARMSRDDVRAMIREEIEAGGREVVRLLRGAAWGMVKGRAAKTDGKIDDVFVGLVEVSDQIDTGFQKVNDDMEESRLKTFTEWLIERGRAGHRVNANYGRQFHARMPKFIDRNPSMEMERKGDGKRALYSRKVMGLFFNANPEHKLLLLKILGKNVIDPNPVASQGPNSPQFDMFKAKH